jgi:proline racemase
VSERRSITAVDTHTEGMPTRVVTGGVAELPGATMLERKLHFERELDDLRLLLMREPRGHAAMSGAILQPALRPDADWGVIFIEVSGCLPMCGHGTMGVATVLVEAGMVEVVEPFTTVRLDTPAGLVTARVEVRDGRAVGVTLRNVPAFLWARERTVSVPGFGSVTYDMAFGGNFYAILPADSIGLAPEAAQATSLIDAGLAIMASINDADRPVHPLDERIAGCRHVVLHAPGGDGASARAATSIHPGWLDRSPCGTGTSARMAQLHARGELAVGEEFINESVIGTRFVGRIVEETEVAGLPAIVPEITGRAWITGMGEYVLEADDPFPAGFRLG